MEVLKTIEARNALNSIAIGYTATWLREQILNRLEDDHGYRGTINDHIITAAFNLLLEEVFHDDGMAITAHIEYACNHAWENHGGPTDPVDVAFDEFQRVSEAVMAQATGLRDRSAAGLPDAITELLEAHEEYLRLTHEIDARTDSDPVVGPSGL